MKIYHNPRCSKSRQTLQLIRDAGKEPAIILYLESIPEKQTLKNLLKKLGLSAKQIIRKNETDFKTNYSGKILSEEEYLNALIKYPKLLERPIVETETKAIIGRPPENVLELL